MERLKQIKQQISKSKQDNQNSEPHTLGDGTTEKELIIRSGYSSRIFEISNVPIPEPVPPPSECVS